MFTLFQIALTLPLLTSGQGPTEAPGTTGAPGAPEAPPATVEDEVRAYVLGQSIGPGSVADLGLPDDYVTRVADRVLRASFDERVGIVIADAPGTTDDGEGFSAATSDNQGASGPGGPADEPVSPLYPASYVIVALGLATWFALRAKRGAA